MHIYVLGLKVYGGGILFKSLSYLYEVVRTNLPADFRTFRQQFRGNCGTTGQQKWGVCGSSETRNEKHHLEGNAIPAGYSHAHMLITRVVWYGMV